MPNCHGTKISSSLEVSNGQKLTNVVSQQLCKNAFFYLPVPSKPYYVQTDASQYTGGGRVFQKDEEKTSKSLLASPEHFQNLRDLTQRSGKKYWLYFISLK